MLRRTLIPILVALLGPAPGALAVTTWTRQFVDVGSKSGTSTSVGLVAQHPVIAYFASSRNLRYAALYPATKEWKLQNVDAGGEFTSLDVDAAGIVHVSYIDANTRQIRYWRLNQGQGTIQLIDSETGSGGFTGSNSIRVDGTGVPHVSYYYWRTPDGSTNLDRLKYARPQANIWSATFADPTAGRGRYNSLALDFTTNPPNPEIAYYDGTAKTLRIARRIAGVWSTQTVDNTAGDVGRFNSIALTAAGNARISYVAAANQKLRYASFNGATWSVEEVADIGLVGDYSATSLRLDSSENPHIAFYSEAAKALLYASRSGGGGWAIDTVDTEGNVGGYSSLVLDDQNRPIISYYDATNQALKIAYGDYPDGDADGIPDTFDACPSNPDCNQNGVPDGREGGVLPGSGLHLPDEPIFGCGSVDPPSGGPPADLLPLLLPFTYLLLRRGQSPAAAPEPRRNVPGRDRTDPGRAGR